MRERTDMTPEATRLAHRHDAVEAGAYRDMFAAAPLRTAAQFGLRTQEVAGATLLVAPGLPTIIFNRVIGLGNAAPASERDLAEIAAVYRSAGVRQWWIHATPGPHHDALRALLGAQGFAVPTRRAWAKVWRDASPPPPVASPVQIALAGKHDAQAVGEVLSASFGMPDPCVPWLAALVGRPGWLTTLARAEGRVIGAGMLQVQGAHGWLGIGGVSADARRLHAHRALMAQRIREAAGRGCTGIFTETGEPAGDEPNPSLRNMEACGFRRVCSRLNFAAPAG